MLHPHAHARTHAHAHTAILAPTQAHTSTIIHTHAHTQIHAPTYTHTQGAGGFYTGYGTTLMREVPFSIIQFPLWEKAKVGKGMEREKEGSLG